MTDHQDMTRSLEPVPLTVPEDCRALSERDRAVQVRRAFLLPGSNEQANDAGDDMVEESFGSAHDTNSIEISETGNNDLCVFVTGIIPNNEATVRLVLSDSTTIGSISP